MARNPFFDLLIGYETPKEKSDGRSVTGKRFFRRTYSGAITPAKKRLLSTGVARFFSAFSHLAAYTRAVAYGAGGLAFGVLTLVFHFMGGYFGAYGETGIYSLVVGLAASVLSLPLLFIEKPTAVFIEENKVLDYIVFEFFCIKRPTRSDSQASVPTVVAVVIGILLAVLGYLVPVYYIGIGIPLFIVACLVSASPEFGFFIGILILPYLSLIPYSDIGFSALIFLTVLSFVRKAAFGKRAVFFEQYDLILALFVLSALISGISHGGHKSGISALMVAAMSFGYFLAGNVVANRRLADGVLRALVISAAPPALIGIVQFTVIAFREGITVASMANIASTFSSSDVFAVFMIVAVTFAVALGWQSHSYDKPIYLLLAVIYAVALILTGELFGVLAIILGSLAFMALKARGVASLFIPLLLFVPYSVFLLPEAVQETLFSVIPSISGAADLARLWSASLVALGDNLLRGIGIGAENFSSVMENYGVIGAQNAGNLFIGIGLEGGIVSLSLFIILLAVRAVHMTVYSRFVRHSAVRRISPMISVAIFCLICYGTADYIWSDMSMFYLFCVVFGLGSAVLRVAKQERDDKLLYEEDTKHSSFSVIDVYVG